MKSKIIFFVTALALALGGCVHAPLPIDYDSFRVLDSELDDPKDLRVVFLGDVHQDYVYEAALTRFVNEHGKKGDIVLLEGVPYGQTVAPKQNILTYGMNPDLKYIGWDDMQLNSKAQNLQTQIDKIEATKDPDSIHQLKELSLARNDFAIKKRNDSLLRALNYFYLKYPKAKIFVIAGERHFTMDPRIGIYLTKKPHLSLAISHEQETHDIRVDNGHRLYSCDSQNRVFLIKLNNRAVVADQEELNHITDKYKVLGLKCLIGSRTYINSVYNYR